MEGGGGVEGCPNVEDCPNEFVVTNSTLNFILSWNTKFYFIFYFVFHFKATALHFGKVLRFLWKKNIIQKLVSSMHVFLSVCIWLSVCSVCVGERSRKLATQMIHWWLNLIYGDAVFLTCRAEEIKLTAIYPQCLVFCFVFLIAGYWWHDYSRDMRDWRLNKVGRRGQPCVRDP